LAVVTNAVYALGKMCSPRPGPEAAGSEGVELVREFSRLNPELQRGALKYAAEVRKAYQKRA